MKTSNKILCTGVGALLLLGVLTAIIGISRLKSSRMQLQQLVMQMDSCPVRVVRCVDLGRSNYIGNRVSFSSNTSRTGISLFGSSRFDDELRIEGDTLVVPVDLFGGEIRCGSIETVIDPHGVPIDVSGKRSCSIAPR